MVSAGGGRGRRTVHEFWNEFWNEWGVTVADMVAALERAAGPEASALIDWVPDPEVARLVTSWPARIRADRAQRLGLAPDSDFGSIIGRYLAESRI